MSEYIFDANSPVQRGGRGRDDVRKDAEKLRELLLIGNKKGKEKLKCKQLKRIRLFRNRRNSSA